MFEMFATIVAACAAAIYGLSRSVFMSGVHRNLYRAAFIGIIILVYVTYRIYHYIKFKNIKKLNVDFDDYLYFSLINVNLSLAAANAAMATLLTFNFATVGAIAFLIGLINAILPEGKNHKMIWWASGIAFALSVAVQFVLK